MTFERHKRLPRVQGAKLLLHGKQCKDSNPYRYKKDNRFPVEDKTKSLAALWARRSWQNFITLWQRNTMQNCPLGREIGTVEGPHSQVTTGSDVSLSQNVLEGRLKGPSADGVQLAHPRNRRVLGAQPTIASERLPVANTCLDKHSKATVPFSAPGQCHGIFLLRGRSMRMEDASAVGWQSPSNTLHVTRNIAKVSQSDNGKRWKHKAACPKCSTVRPWCPVKVPDRNVTRWQISNGAIAVDQCSGMVNSRWKMTKESESIQSRKRQRSKKSCIRPWHPGKMSSIEARPFEIAKFNIVADQCSGMVSTNTIIPKRREASAVGWPKSICPLNFR